MMRVLVASGVAAAAVLAVTLTGCSDRQAPQQPAPAEKAGPQPPADKVAAERAKLSDTDRALVEAQEWCAIQTDERLGSMGPPVKLEIKGQPVFVCCKGCKKETEADPDKTLARVEELKAQKAAAAGRP